MLESNFLDKGNPISHFYRLTIWGKYCTVGAQIKHRRGVMICSLICIVFVMIF